MLHKLTLFKDVKITPDYSVVHDLTPSDWKDYLVGTPLNPTPNGDIVWEGMVNYYRLPDVIRIEGNYDTLRKVTYGMVDCARGTDETQLIINESMERPMFFFVKNVRLVKQESRVDKDEVSTPMVWDVRDVVELEIEVDVWSSNNGSFELYDSYVERRHMPRWNNAGTELNPDWKPIYYPNAGQGVDGAYRKEADEDLTPPVTFITQPNKSFDPRFIVVFALDTAGQAKVYIGIDVVDETGTSVDVYHTYSSKKIFGVKELLDGTFYGNTGANISADFIQSITVVPVVAGLTETLKLNIAGGVFYLTFNEISPIFAQTYSLGSGSGLGWVTLNFGVERLANMMFPEYPDVTVIEPDHDAVPLDGEYLDEHEPMMYLAPARIRKVTTSFGGEVFQVPDIMAFSDYFTVQNLFDMTGAVTYVFAKGDILEANAQGAMGVLDAATLPIYNSAWKSYEAINKVGDEIAYNAKQLQTFANGAAGTASNAIIGGAIGGVLGGAANIITGIVGTGSAMYGNAEELRAKQVTIRNSPCNVKSGGSGLGAYVNRLTDIRYVTLKIDDQSLEKLRFMYYWYGYHVNRVFKGTVDLSTREVFDFLKTNGAKVRGDLTAGAAQQIADIFDRGVTIYHGTAGYEEIGSGSMKENDEI